MSRVGRMPIDIPAGVNVNLDGHVITVKGPKGELTRTLHQDMKITVADNVITVERPSDDKNHRALHGLTRALIANMVKGVSEGFKKELEIVGVGYRAQMKGKKTCLDSWLLPSPRTRRSGRHHHRMPERYADHHFRC